MKTEGSEVLKLDVWDLTKLADFKPSKSKDLCKTKMFNVVLVCLES